MKYSQLIATPRMLRKEDAGKYVGGPKMLEWMERANWIKPAVAQHKMTIYDIRQLDACCDRLGRGEFPQGEAATA
jgi:hypothetical protein